MGVGRASAPQNFPPLFGAYHRTEVLAAYHREGPVRAAVMRMVFPQEATLSVDRPRSNQARLLAKAKIGKGRKGGATVVGINPNLQPEVRAAMGDLLAKLDAEFHAREVPNDIRPSEVQTFLSAENAPVRLEAFSGPKFAPQRSWHWSYSGAASASECSSAASTANS
jgi:hypothetical protein